MTGSFPIAADCLRKPAASDALRVTRSIIGAALFAQSDGVIERALNEVFESTVEFALRKPQTVS